MFPLLCCALLTRCAPAPEPVVVRPDVPATLLTCEAAPVAPDLNVPRWDQVLAGYLLDLGAAGDDCRAKLRAVGKFAVSCGQASSGNGRRPLFGPLNACQSPNLVGAQRWDADPPVCCAKGFSGPERCITLW